VLWTPELSPTTIILDAAPTDFANATVINVAALGEIVADHDASDGRHMVIASPNGLHRLWLREIKPNGSLAVIIPADRNFAQRIAAVTRFERRLRGTVPEQPPPGYRPTAFQRNRLSLLLNLLDAEKAGASRRTMASTFLYRNSAPMDRAEWKGSSQRRRTQRMIDEAKQIMASGYRDLLRGD
jgi:hypothetical protein